MNIGHNKDKMLGLCYDDVKCAVPSMFFKDVHVNDVGTDD
jgi:hypothetical protein